MKYEPEIVAAAEYVRKIANGKKIETEKEVILYRDGKELTFGTFDAYCKGHLFDLKTGMEIRNYLPQMAVYVAALCQRDNIDEIQVHLIYSSLGKTKQYTISREEAEELSYGIVDTINDETRSPRPCQYCSWCDLRNRCTALNTMAITVSEKTDMIKSTDIASISDPVTMGQFREVADAMDVWSKAVKDKCDDFDEISGYNKTTRKGKKYISDITAALIHSGLPSEMFVDACTVSFPKLRKKFAEHKGISEDEANEELSRLLESVMKQGKPVRYWRKIK